MAGLVGPPLAEGGTVVGLEGGNGDDEGGAIRTVEMEPPDMAGGEDTSAVDVMVTGPGGSEAGIVTAEVGSTGIAKPLDCKVEDAPWDDGASLVMGSSDRFDNEVADAVTAFESEGAAVIAPATSAVVVVEVAVDSVLVGGVEDAPVVVVVGGGTDGGIEDCATKETEETEEVMLAKVPLSIMARRVWRLRNSLSFSRALSTRAILRTTGS